MAEWHDLYLATAGASAALAGLVFAISINIERMLTLQGVAERGTGDSPASDAGPDRLGGLPGDRASAHRGIDQGRATSDDQVPET
jgi:hypothetical protein